MTLPAAMVTLLITSVFILGLFAIAIYFWQKPARNPETFELPPPPRAVGLFPAEDDLEPEQQQLPEPVEEIAEEEQQLKKAEAGAFMAAWQESPDRNSTAKMLHLAALADDAETYRQAVESAFSAWQRGSLPDLSATELQHLFSSQFWLLSSHTRSSGAGFVLKRTLSRAKRELETS